MSTNQYSFSAVAPGRLSLLVASVLIPLALCPKTNAEGTWQKIPNAPADIQTMLLLSDGVVMAEHGANLVLGNVTGYDKDWYYLYPNGAGSYNYNGWVQAHSMHEDRLWFGSCVLRDGRVFVVGAEYGDGTVNAEVYDPRTGLWALTAPPLSLLNPGVISALGVQNQAFAEPPIKLLPDGTVLVPPTWPAVAGQTLIYDPNANSWTNGPTFANGAPRAAEESWVKLPDDSILKVDADTLNSQRYIPSLNQWLPDAPVPVALYANLLPVATGEIGAAFMLPDGRAFFLGGTGATAFYSPSGNTSPGHWTSGPNMPYPLGAADAPAAMMVNGKILCALALPPFVNGGSIQFNKPAYFYEFDPVTSSFTQIHAPDGSYSDNIETEFIKMLALPDGKVLYSHFNNEFYIYTPDSGPQASWKPTITGISPNADGSYHLTGTQLNGISEGAAFGDDAQMDSNFPLVRLTDASANVFYARTYNWSSTGVQTGNRPVSTEFEAANLLPGNYSLVVVANGISSDPTTLSAPAWVDFTYNNLFFQNGSFAFPFSTLAQGTNAVSAGGTIAIKGPGINFTSGRAVSSETMTISKPMTITTVGGPATIGLNP